MTSKEFLKRLKNIDMIYKTDENGNISEIISCGETYENHFKKLEKDLEILEEIRNTIKVIDYGEKYRNRYVLQVGNDIYQLWMEEDYNRWARWLDNGKD